MILFAPASKKYVMGGPASGLVCVSVNRLTLYLRSYMLDFDTQPGKGTLTTLEAPVAPRRRHSRLGASTLDMFVHDDDGSRSFEMEMRDTEDEQIKV